MNVVAMENRADSTVTPKCVNIRITSRQRNLDPELRHACPYCESTGSLCARVVDDGHSLKLCIFPSAYPGDRTWEVPGFWLETAQDHALESEPSQFTNMDFERSRRDKALGVFASQPAGAPASQGSHEALEKSNEDNRALRRALGEVVDNSKAKHKVQEAEIKRLQEALNASNAQLQSLRNALHALNSQYNS